MEKLFTKYSFELVFGLLGLLGGFVKISQKMLCGMHVSWRTVLAHSIISAFSCLMAGVLLDWLAPQLPLEAKMFLSGMTGYWGIAGLTFLFNSVVERR